MFLFFFSTENTEIVEEFDKVSFSDYIVSIIINCVGKLTFEPIWWKYRMVEKFLLRLYAFSW